MKNENLSAPSYTELTQLLAEENKLLKEQLKTWQDQACDFVPTFTKDELRLWSAEVIFVFMTGTAFGAIVVGLAK